MLGFLGPLIMPIISALGQPFLNSLVEGYKAKLASVDNADTHAIELAKADLMAQMQARHDAASLTGFASFVQFMFAFPIIVYADKVIIWDKVLGLGSTDPITGEVGQWASLIISFYFGGQIISGVVSAVARRFGK